MPKREARNPTSAKGDWFIDDRCIDCAASREVAPGLIVERGGKSVFARQPVGGQDVNRLRPMDCAPSPIERKAADDRRGVQTVVLSCSRRNVPTASRAWSAAERLPTLPTKPCGMPSHTSSLASTPASTARAT